ncbi:hypothetical protein SV7mr_49400 [Stieleria bergensis]|uniref:Uncharacterized protein n=1 Tax=Stieleria bergensis TaxID=2528025 RepID=A0A517T201_9BACT|nr:hypothetical protein SV7mr_49400 [Planctomycetes bacterium SV_7m_r]
MAVPEPLVLERGVERAKRIRQIALDENGFAKPSVQDAVEHDAGELRLLDSDRFEVRLVVEPPTGIVVARRIPSSDIKRHVQATSDLVEDLFFKLAVRGRWLLALHLSHLPTAGHRQQHSLFKLDRFKRFGRIGLTIRGSVGVENASEFSRSFRSCKDRKRESPQLCKQWQRRCDVRDASNLSRAIATKVMDNIRCWHGVVFIIDDKESIAGVILQYVVRDRIPSGIEPDAIEIAARVGHQSRRGDLVGFDQLQIEVHRSFEPFVARKQSERFTIGNSR